LPSNIPKRATPEDYNGLFRRLLPRGVIWAAQRGTRFARVLLGLAAAPAREHNRALDVIDFEMLPSTATETLEAWERNLGLPDPCAPIPTTISERQAIAAARYVASGGQTAAYYIEVAAALGFTIIVNETPYEAFRVGRNTVGQPLGRQEAIFYVQIQAPAAMTADERAHLECLFGRIKPAHIVFEYSYVL